VYFISQKPLRSSLSKEVIFLKEWECEEVGHHKNIGSVIKERQERGWRLHSYQAAGLQSAVNHYLLFERGTADSF
jgi:hypothetical protein